MALGLLLWVSWICSFLFNGSLGLPAIKGYGYPYVPDSRNIGDDGEDEVLNSPIFDQTNWQASNNHGMGYSKPSVAQQPDLVPTSQNLPNTPSAHGVEKLINGESIDWGLDNLDEAILFPLRPNNQLNDPAKPQLSPTQPQSSVSVASTNRVPLSPNTGGSTQYASPSTYYNATLSYTSQASSSYGVADYGFGNQNQDFNTGSSGDGGNSSKSPHLVFEEVFQLPSENTGVSATVGGYSQVNDPGLSPGYPSNVGARPARPSNVGARPARPSNVGARPARPSNVGARPARPSNVGARPARPSNVGARPARPSNVGARPFKMVSPSSSFLKGKNLYFSRTRYQPRDISSWLQQKPVVNTQKVEFSQRVSDPIPPPPPSSYIIQSRNGYQRSRYLLTESKYSPEFPIAVSSNGVKSPAPSQPTASKGVKNPERTKW